MKVILEDVPFFAGTTVERVDGITKPVYTVKRNGYSLRLRKGQKFWRCNWSEPHPTDQKKRRKKQITSTVVTFGAGMEFAVALLRERQRKTEQQTRKDQ